MKAIGRPVYAGASAWESLAIRAAARTDWHGRPWTCAAEPADIEPGRESWVIRSLLLGIDQLRSHTRGGEEEGDRNG